MFMILSSSDKLSFRSPVRADEARAGAAAEDMVGADDDDEEGSLAKNGGGS